MPCMAKALFDIELNIESVPTEPIDTIECMRTLLTLETLFNSLCFHVVKSREVMARASKRTSE